MMKELEIGDYVTPSVRLLAPLAQGGMGTVWIAEHLVLETHVVVKLMTRQVAGHAEGAARFAGEAAIAAAVKSPHVVQVFDSGVTDAGVAYIVMELLEGRDLAADLAAHGRMAPEEVAIVVAQLVKALASAHRVGVVHRDIKPENVFLCDTEPGELFVKLLDFGTAKDEARAPFATVAGSLLGTPYYMSPEQLLGAEIDARADVWSLGVLAFEALTGTRPFDGATVGAITLAIHSTAPRLTDVVPGLPPSLDGWFARACARDPAERFHSARAAGDAFAHAMKGYGARSSAHDDVDGVHAVPLTRRISYAGRPATRPERLATSLSATLAPPPRGHRMTTWAVGGVFAASVLGMLAAFTYDQPRAAQRLSPPAPSVVVAPVGSPAAPQAPPAPAPPPPPSTAATPAPSTPSTPSTPPVPAAPSVVATSKTTKKVVSPPPAPLPPPPARVTATTPAEPSAAPPSMPAPEPEVEPTPEPDPDPPADPFREPD